MEAEKALKGKSALLLTNDSLIAVLDSTVKNDQIRIAARDTLILKKSQTIKGLTGLSTASINTPTPWVFAVLGMLIMAFALK